jgi:uncharacterized membrane protein
MSTPFWALTAAYWFHMLATVMWIGGLTVFALVVLPSAQKILEDSALTLFISQIHRRINLLGWLSIVVLTVSGMIQMSANKYYGGFLTFTGLWSRVILTKHILFLIMAGISGYITWSLFPAIQRAELLKPLEIRDQKTKQLQKRLHLVSTVNLLFGLVVLLLTAIARSV